MMLAFANVADVLGLSANVATRSPIGLVTEIEHGLPIGVVERIAKLIAPTDAQFKYRLIARATYERRKASKTLSAEEGIRLARLARVWSLALDVWKDAEEAREFLFRPHLMIEDRRPIDVIIQSEFGADLGHLEQPEIWQCCVTPQPYVHLLQDRRSNWKFSDL